MLLCKRHPSVNSNRQPTRPATISKYTRCLSSTENIKLIRDGKKRPWNQLGFSRGLGEVLRYDGVCSFESVAEAERKPVSGSRLGQHNTIIVLKVAALH